MKVAKLMRFYGLGLDEAWNLECEAAEMLWKAITVIEAQDALTQVQIVSYPESTKQSQDNFHRSMHKMAFPDIYEKPVVITADQMASLLNG